MSDKAKVYPLEGDGPFRVWLSWKGKRYSRGYYDHRINLIYRDLADRLADSINMDIDDKGDLFDPRDWFASDKELQFSYAVDKWYAQKEYAPGTIRNVEYALGRAKEFFRDQNIKTIRKAHLKMLLDTLTQAPRTKRSIMGHIKSALNDICDDWHLMRVPFPAISVPYREQKWMTREEQDTVIDVIPDHDKPIFRLLQAYGCRISEACALMWDCIDFNKREIVFKRTFSGERHLRETTKTGYHRRNPLSDAIVGLLRPLRLDISSKFVFKNPLGNHYQRAPLNKVWKRACGKTDLEYVSIENAFRHSKINQLKIAGYDLKTIADFVGHRNIRTTEIYSTQILEMQREMVG